MSITTVPSDAAHRAASEIEEWLTERGHLRNTGVRWDSDREELIVRMEGEFFGTEEAGDALAEELQEIASGTLVGYDRARVDVLQVDLLER